MEISMTKKITDLENYYQVYLKQTITVFFLLILMVFQQAFAEESGKMSFDLNAARQYARQHNYDVWNSELAINAASQQIKEIAAGGFPQISGSAEYQNFLDIPTS